MSQVVLSSIDQPMKDAGCRPKLLYASASAVLAGSVFSSLGIACGNTQQIISAGWNPSQTDNMGPARGMDASAE